MKTISRSSSSFDDVKVHDTFASRYGTACVRNTADDGLDQVLQSADTFVELIEVASQLYACENIRFWKALNEFKGCTSGDARRVHALWICDSFIVPESKYEINLASQERQKLIALGTTLRRYFDDRRTAPPVVSPDVFDAAADSVRETIRESVYAEYREKVRSRSSSLSECFQGFNYDTRSRPVGIYGSMECAPEEIDQYAEQQKYLSLLEQNLDANPYHELL